MNAAKKVTLEELGEMVTHIVAHMATKDDIANMATKDDIANMATKDDIANMATKDDVRMIVREELEPIETRLTSIESELASIRRDLDDLQKKVDNATGFSREIDHALGRIAAIEKHLGIKREVSA